MRNPCTPTGRLLAWHTLPPTNTVVACYRWILMRPAITAQHQ